MPSDPEPGASKASLPPIGADELAASDAPGVGTPAGFWIRALAYMIDVIPFVVAVWFVSGLLDTSGHDQAYTLIPPGDREGVQDWLIVRSLRRSTAFLLYIAYAALLESSPWQATLGKRLLGLRSESVDGRRLTPARAWGRNVAKILSSLPLGLGFYWAGLEAHKRAWHDLLARTRVVRTRS